MTIGWNCWCSDQEEESVISSLIAGGNPLAIKSAVLGAIRRPAQGTGPIRPKEQEDSTEQDVVYTTSNNPENKGNVLVSFYF